MAYEKLNLTNGSVLTADHMAHIENGIYSSAPSGLVHGYRSCASDAEIDAFITEQFNDSAFENRTKRNVVVYVSQSGPTLTYPYNWLLEIFKSSANMGHITATSYGGGKFVILRRTWNSGALKEWLYENPPMAAGTEYATTEIFDGNTVYRKRIVVALEAFGSSSTTESVTIAHGISNFGNLVSIDARNKDILLPAVSSIGGICYVRDVTASNMTLRAYQVSMGANTWYFDLKYTKAK